MPRGTSFLKGSRVRYWDPFNDPREGTIIYRFRQGGKFWYYVQDRAGDELIVVRLPEHLELIE